MGEASFGVEAPPVASPPLQQPINADPVPPSAAPEVVDTKAHDSGDANKTGAASDEETLPTQGTGSSEADAAVTVIGTGTRADKEPAAHGANLSSSPATPPKTPERDVAPPTRAGEHAVLGAETALDVDPAKSGGCTTPVHDMEGSDRRSADGHGSLLHGAGASVKRDVAATKSRLLTFRSFTRDKKVNNKLTPPLSPVHGKAGEDAAEHKERRKRFWK